MPFFSIVIPVYNVEAYLVRCLESILEDQCGDLEIILVDDGSTDNSGAICDQYAERYENIRVVHKENGGLSSARNAGMREASGEWISFIDSDDWVVRDSYQLIKDLLSAVDGSADIVKTGYKIVCGDKVTECIPCAEPGIYNTEEIREKLLPLAMGNRLIANNTIDSFILSAWSHLYRREFLVKTGVTFVSEREIGSEDFLFIYSLYMRADSILVTDLTWYNYFTRTGSLTQRYRERMFDQYRKLGKKVKKQLEITGLYPSYKDDFRGLYISLMYMCIMNECNNPVSRTEQVRHVKNILKNGSLESAVKNYSGTDLKSRVIAWMMEHRTAAPLCMIQWRKTKRSV